MRSFCIKSTEKYANGLRLVIISDTHNLNRKMPKIPLGDILLHSGDFTENGTLTEIKQFKEWFNNKPHKVKLFIAGNHEHALHTESYQKVDIEPPSGARKFHYITSKETALEISKTCQEIVRGHGSIFLEVNSHVICDFDANHTSTTENIENNHSVDITDKISINKTESSRNNTQNSIQNNNKITVYGSPWTPYFCNWAFNAQRGNEIAKIWEKIPDDVDILLTHGPPKGILDSGFGCEDLLNTVQNRVKPRIHIFGHVHSAYGSWHASDKIDKKDTTDSITINDKETSTTKKWNTLYINASICDENNFPTNLPIVVHLPFDRSQPAVVVPLEDQLF